MKPWLSATARLPGTCAGMLAASGGTSGRSERNTMPVCCCVSPVHSDTCTGSDTVGKPTSTRSASPCLHSADQFGSVRAICSDRPSIKITRTRDAGVMPGPVPCAIATGSVGRASHVITSRISSRRTPGTTYAYASSAAAATSAAIRVRIRRLE